MDGKISNMIDEKTNLEVYLIGLMSADGGLYTYIDKKHGCQHGYQTDFVADASLEFCETVKKIVQEIFDLNKVKVTIRKHHKANCFYVQSYNKKMFYEVSKRLQIPIGAKTTTVQIPQVILRDKNMIKFYLRGVFDGEGSAITSKFIKKNKLYRYPKLLIKISSVVWINDISKALTLLKIKHTKFEYPNKKRFEIHITGIKNVSDFFNKIGTNHPEKAKKFISWGMYH